MYTLTWSKYVPIIRILLKKAVASDQTLDLNTNDFERVGLTAKPSNKFDIKFIKGKVENVISPNLLARDLTSLLQEDSAVQEIFSRNDFEIAMNPKFQMSFRCLSRDQYLLKGDAKEEVTSDKDTTE
jgi:hypothetical protein